MATTQEINAQARSGIKILMIRQGLLQVLAFACGVVLARVLDPAEFGLFAIASLTIALFSLIGEFGLVPSFIQRQAELTQRELQVGFTLQQLLTTAIVLCIWAAAPWVVALYPQAPAGTEWLIRAVALNLFPASWRAMSTLNLERWMHYAPVARIEVGETLVYQGAVITLALCGYGVWSLIWATLLRSVSGAILAYAAAPWRVGFHLDRQIARQIVRRGLPFQLQNVANQVGASVTPLALGAVMGPTELGLLTWASSNGTKPLLLAQVSMRVAFPHLARLQAERAEVERLIVRYLTYLLLPAGLWLAVLFGAGHDLVAWIYTHKWLPAVPTLVLYAALVSVNITVWLVASALNSLGQVHVTTRVVIYRCIGQLVLGLSLAMLMGLNGVPISLLLVELLMLPVLLAGYGSGAWRRLLPPLAWIVWPLVLAMVAGAATWAAPEGPLRAILTTFLAAAVFAAASYQCGPAWLHASIRERLQRR